MKPDRFWDVFVTGSSGWYDFAGAILDQASYTAGKLSSTPVFLIDDSSIPDIKGTLSRGNTSSSSLPDTGYVASAVSITDIRNHTFNLDVKNAVEWVSDTYHVGKIRINAHGDTDGGIMFMHRSNGDKSPDLCHFFRIADWLEANKLKHLDLRGMWRTLGKAHGISTINLAVCHSSKTRDSQAANIGLLLSGVDQVAERLKKLDYTSISVTGHADPFSVVPSDRAKLILAAHVAEEWVMTLTDSTDSLWDDKAVADITALNAVIDLIDNKSGLTTSRQLAYSGQAKSANTRTDLKNVLIAAFTEVNKGLLDTQHSGLTEGHLAVNENGKRVRFAHLSTKERRRL